MHINLIISIEQIVISYFSRYFCEYLIWKTISLVQENIYF
jgi:hypothetical protein